MKAPRLLALILFFAFFSSCSNPGGRNRVAKTRDNALSGPISRVDDMARFLAGMPGGANSPYASLRKTAAWQAHSAEMDKLFNYAENTRLGPIKRWQGSELGDLKSGFVFYPFGGPDFAFANAFFPRANKYVLVGLEGANPIPDLKSLSAGEVSSGLSNLRNSLRTIVYSSYFITKDMRSDLAATRINGTLPLVLTFMARSGHRIQSIEMVDITSGGGIGSRSGSGGAAPGYHIVARGPGGGTKHVYYFREDLSNGGLSDGRMLKFVASQGTPVTYLKSASYLMHSGGFSTIRNAILNQSSAIVTDPSGVPFRYLADRNTRLYGQYNGPLQIFSEHDQGDLRRAYQSGYKVGSMPFGVGYRQTCLIVSKR